MKKLLFGCLLIFINQPLFATSIVVLITQNYIIIGADSKRMIIDAEKDFTTNQTVCKIRRVGNYCYAAAGLVASASTSFSTDSIINYHLKHQKNFDKALKAIQKDITTALQRELQVQKEKHPAQYHKTLEMKANLLEVVILSINNQVPQAHILGFELTDEKNTTIKTYTAVSSGNNAHHGKQFFFLGEYSGMEKYLNTMPSQSDPVKLVNQLILSQSQITPSSVGAPVSLVKFSTQGMEWINNSCNTQ